MSTKQYGSISSKSTFANKLPECEWDIASAISENISYKFNPKKKDMRHNMTLYFYNAMLKHIIKTKEVHVMDSEESIHSIDRILKSRPYKESCEAELLPVNEIESDVDVDRSAINNVKYRVLKRNKSNKHSYRTYNKGYERSSKKIRKSQFQQQYYDSLMHLHTVHKVGFNSLLTKRPIKNWIIEPKRENVQIKFTNGNIYEGTLFGKKMHGQGKFIWKNGTVYMGEFKHGEITGTGHFQYPDKSVYIGDVYKNKRHGYGVLYLANSACVYKGEWYLNLKHGHGWQIFDANNTYEGDWFNDIRKGAGIRIYSTHARYYGKFKMGLRHGYGIAVMNNNDIYSGDWIEGQRDGFGDYIWDIDKNHYFAVPVQNCYYGSWTKNKRDGIGVMNFGMEGGSRYAGYFSNNEKHGAGIIICENGHVIESDPLFINDKPVHVTDLGELENNSQPSSSSNNISSNEFESDMLDSVENTFLDRKIKLLSRFPLDKKFTIVNPIDESSKSDVGLDKCTTFKQNINNSDVYNVVFGKIQDQYSSFPIPIAISSELIDINIHIYKIIETKLKTNLTHKATYNNESTCMSQTNSWFLSRTISRTSKSTYTDYELHKFEERLLRKVIAKYVGRLKTIYYLYAKIGCLEQNDSFKPWLIRMFFWQFYRDCKITEKGLSLIDIDLMLSEKFTFDVHVTHNPFEVIYFWQFLESLLHVSWELYGQLFISATDGVLKSTFEHFLLNDIFPYAGHFTGCAFFDYKDVIPVKAAYAWYKSIGEPHTILDFLRNMCHLRKRKRGPPKPETFDLPYIQIGRNVLSCANKILYFEDENAFNLPILRNDRLKSVKHEDTKKLYFLDVLKPRKVVKILSIVCPGIKLNADLVNSGYKLNFLEFYEVILLCTQEKVNLERKHNKVHGVPVKVSKRTEIVCPEIIFQQIHKKKSKRASSVGRKSKKAQG